MQGGVVRIGGWYLVVRPDIDMNETYGAADERIMVLDVRMWRLVGWSRIHSTSNSGAGLDQQELGAYCSRQPFVPFH